MREAEKVRAAAAALVEGALWSGPRRRLIEAIRALPLPEPPPALAEALRQHEEVIALVGRWEQANVARPFGTAPDADPRPRAVETRAALLDAMALPVAHGLDLGAIGARADAAAAWLGRAGRIPTERHLVEDLNAGTDHATGLLEDVAVLLAALRAAPPDVVALTREAQARMTEAGYGVEGAAVRAEPTLKRVRWALKIMDPLDPNDGPAWDALARLLLALPKGAS